MTYEPSHAKQQSAICICETKGADQRHCFRYTDSTILLLLESNMSSLLPSSVTAQTGLCLTCSEETFVFSREVLVLSAYILMILFVRNNTSLYAYFQTISCKGLLKGFLFLKNTLTEEYAS